MRKYEHQKESRNFAQLLGMTDAYMVRLECGARYFNRPMLLLKYKITFYWTMIKFGHSLERGRRVDFFSHNDFLKLRTMWWNVFKRTYEPQWMRKNEIKKNKTCKEI